MLSITNVNQNPQRPSVSAEAFIPDQLIAGELKIVSDVVTLTGGAALKRGAVLGKITASGKYTLAASAAADGSNTPVAILADDADPSGGDVKAGVYLTGEFNTSALSFGAGTTAASAKAAFRPIGIFLKDAVSAADPA